MRHIAVIGLGFGDEGKGRVVDWLCATQTRSSNAIVVRFSGGPQAAHRVVLPDGREHIFSSYGSGTLRGIPTMLKQEVLINPIAILNEFDILKPKCETTPKLFVDERCPVITPYDIEWNRQSKERNNGTCGSGIFATIRREKAGCHLLFEDLFARKSVLKLKIEQVARFYRKLKTPPEYNQMFLDACEEMIGRDAARLALTGALTRDLIIYEGSQGLLLDQNYGFYPYVTPSNTGLKNIYLTHPEIYMVTRAYQTRHGNGPMSPIVKNKIKTDENERNIYNKFQGEFRKTLLDIDLLKYAISKDIHINSSRSKHLFITCMDHVEEEKKMFINGEINEERNEIDFIMKIRNELEAVHLYTSNGPTSEDVTYCI